MKTKTTKNEVEGIGGWLIIPVGGLFLNIYFLFSDILFAMSTYYMDSFIAILIFIDIIFIVFASVCLVAIFNKKKYVRKLMISYYISSAIVWLCLGIPYYIITLIIWGSYFHNSKRVKNTFIN